VDLDHLADMLAAFVEGGIIVSKVIREKGALSQQLRFHPRGFPRDMNDGSRHKPTTSALQRVLLHNAINQNIP
jgi:hypothetical protein